MPTSETANLERLDLLEAKVSQAARAVETLTDRCRDLTKVNDRLQKQIAELTDHNKRLLQQVEELKSAPQTGSAGKLEHKKILSRIDRMIEKFGELQV